MALTYLISDLHLHPDCDERTYHFSLFIEHCLANQANLYVLGDFFEYWVGPDQIKIDYYHNVFRTLARLARSQSVYLMRGNRDFLYHDAFCSSFGVHLIDDPCLLHDSEERILLSHGDRLCTDDHEHMRFRSQTVCNPTWQKQFLRQPLAERMRFAQSVRTQSNQHKDHLSSEIMDVNAQAVAALMRQYQSRTLIHGHTHRPAKHSFYLDGGAATRFVLGAWYEAPITYLQIGESEEAMLQQFPFA